MKNLFPFLFTTAGLGLLAFQYLGREVYLCEDFNLEELTRTGTGLANVPSPEALANLSFLCREVLQPFRDTVGRLQVTSGYRSPQVNAATGGHHSSYHMQGMAVDVVPLDTPYPEAWGSLLELIAEGAPIDKAGNYAGTEGHIHIQSKGPTGNRGEVYYA